MEIRPLPPTCEVRDKAADPREGEQSASRSERRDKNALADKLTHQHAASGAERQAGRHLLAALQCPRQKKAGHIRARDQEQEHRRYTREFEEVENLFLDVRDSQQTPADRFKAHPLKIGRVPVAAPLRILEAGKLLRHFRHNRRKQIGGGRSQFWFCKAANEVVARGLIQQSLHARRQPDGGLHEVESVELPGRNADDLDHLAIQRDSAADDVGRPAQLSLPKAMTDHRHAVRAHLGVFFRKKPTPQRRRDAEKREVIARNQLHVDALCGFLGTQFRHDARVADDSFEHACVLADGFVVGSADIGEDRLPS